MALNTNIEAVAGLCVHEVLDRATAQILDNTERMGELLLQALDRRGLTLAHATVHTLDATQPMPLLLQVPPGDTLGPLEDTVEIELPLALRVQQAMQADSTLELERTHDLEGACFLLRRQAE